MLDRLQRLLPPVSPAQLVIVFAAAWVSVIAAWGLAHLFHHLNRSRARRVAGAADASTIAYPERVEGRAAAPIPLQDHAHGRP